MGIILKSMERKLDPKRGTKKIHYEPNKNKNVRRKNAFSPINIWNLDLLMTNIRIKKFNERWKLKRIAIEKRETKTDSGLPTTWRTHLIFFFLWFQNQQPQHGNFFCQILQSQWYWQMPAKNYTQTCSVIAVFKSSHYTLRFFSVRFLFLFFLCRINLMLFYRL